MPRRSFAPQKAKTAAPKVETGAGDILSALAGVLKRGQQKKVLALTEQALSLGIDAQAILSGGLIRGMNELGEDFPPAGLVPEMLMAARCMAAATALLKPHMVDAAGARQTIGSACIGTVRGDMHDIGKNLVKIMLEGSNIQVYDLGGRRAAGGIYSRSPGASLRHHRLLGSTDHHHAADAQVVDLAREAGIRDRVCIMVGGAPISQSFCDEIHADLYTPDAASAARAAVDRLTHPAK